MAAGEIGEGGVGGSGGGGRGDLALVAGSRGTTTLAHLPAAVMETVLLKLDVPSLCSVAVTCRILHDYATHTLSFLPALHLSEISPTLDLLRPLLPPNPYLRSLKLDCGRLDDSAIGHLARPSLEELCLFNCDRLSGRLLSELGRRCMVLRSLSLISFAEQRGCSVLFSDLEELLSGCSQLESLCLVLDMSKFAHPKFSEVWKTASGKLATLEISFIPTVMISELFSKAVSHEASYSVKPPMFSSLQKLCLSMDFITDGLISSISEGLACLSYLDLQDAPITEPSGALDLTNAGLQQINLHGKLKHISLVRSQEYLLTYFKRVNDLGFLLLADTCSSLESICLGGFCRVTDTGFRAILHSCPRLGKLKVTQGSQLTDLVFHDISATSLCLTHVSLRRCNRLTDLAISSLSFNTDLTVLDLRESRNLGDGAITALSTLPKLQILLLDGTDVSDLGLSYLSGRLTSLVSLSVRGCKGLTDDCISSIFNHSIGGVLQVVDLSRLPNLSDDGILLLAKSGVPIAELRMRECPLIGDVAVMALASMQVGGRWLGSSLRLLDLYDSGGITQLAFRWFKRPYFPRLRWLGVTGSSNRDLVDALVRSRPFLNIACCGEDLGTSCWDASSSWYWPEEEEVDELEQWLLEGGDVSEEDMDEG
uniref:F-box/LRR-repeat protein 10 n=2 Tax=Anthurium amnicola TaxID=1678845 RepID=A0A1D1XDD0_9ARAE